MPAVINSPQLSASFASLSVDTVKLFTCLDALAVSCENDVAVLLSIWHAANSHSCADSDLQELSARLRCSHVTRSFRHAVLPTLPWFRLQQLLTFFNLACDDSSSACTAVTACNDFPAAWSAPARQHTQPVESSSKVTFSRSALQSLVEGAREKGWESLDSAPFYSGGSYWQLRCKHHVTGQLAVYLFSSGSMHANMPEPSAVKAKYQITHTSRTGKQKKVAASQQPRWFRVGKGWGCIRGCPDAFPGKAVRVLGDYSRWSLVGGTGDLVLECSVEGQ